MNWDALNEIIQRHGGMLSPPVAVDPLIDNPDPVDRRLNPKIENPSPAYRYNLKDGKSFTAKGNETGEGDQKETTYQIIDPGNAVQPLTPADRLPSPSSQLTRLDARGNVIPTGDTTTPVAKLRDESTGTVTDLPDAKSSPDGTVKEFGNQLLNIKPDGTYTVIASKPAEGEKQQAKTTFDGPDGGRYEYDPNATEGKRLTQLLPPPPDKTKPSTEVRNGKTYQYDPSTKSWTEAAGLPTEKKPVAVSTNTQARELVGLDEQGNVVSREPNPNYVGEKSTQLPADLVAPNIPLLKPDGTIAWVPNENRVMANDAMQALLDQAGAKVNAKQMSMADAKELLTGAVNTMNAQTSQTNAATAQQQAQTAQQAQVRGAAGDILQAGTQRAQTGAGLLQQRAQAATGTLQSIVGNALSNKNITSIPGDVGANLVGGLQGWTADLMGGQATMDSAARMIQAADPQSNLADPTTQAAISTLRQMLDKHQELTGQLLPAVAATQAAQQSQQTGGMVAPGGYNPADIQWNQPPQNAPGRTMGPGGVITGPQPVQAVAPIQPVPVASGFQAPMAQVPGQNYGAGMAYTGGIAPWLAQPQPAFVAPMPQPLTAASILGGR